jgi:hypothetical protein
MIWTRDISTWSSLRYDPMVAKLNLCFWSKVHMFSLSCMLLYVEFLWRGKGYYGSLNPDGGDRQLCTCTWDSQPTSIQSGSEILSCMYRPVQLKNLIWWGEVSNSLIFQHSPSRGGSLRPQMWNRSEQQLFYLIALTRIRTRDLWLWYCIELHAPTSSTQKLKLMGRGGQFTYIPTRNMRTRNRVRTETWSG